MANRSKSVHTIREIIRLRVREGMKERQTARALNLSRPCVSRYSQKFMATGMTWEEFEKKTDKEINDLFNSRKKATDQGRYQELEEQFPYMRKELGRTGVTLELLWQEYRQTHAGGYGYSQFCHYYGRWNMIAEVWMHQEHKAGDKMFVDFAGDKLTIKGLKPGLDREVEVFIAVLGCSRLAYVEAVESQKKEDWIQGNGHALRYFGGVPKAIVPDCLKSGVKNGNKYEPEANPEYADFARHYGTVILPARPMRPRDKALVEETVKDIYRRIYARMRDEEFHGIEELNARIMELLEEHNNMKFQKMDGSRRDLFESMEAGVLGKMPDGVFELKRYEERKVWMNYHVMLKADEHHYSVPYRYAGEKVKLVYTASTVEIYHNFERIALHKRERRKYQYTTLEEHMPSHHKFYAEWTPERISRWAETIGMDVKKMVEGMMKERKHPEQAYKSSVGVISLSRKYGNDRVNNACQRALFFQCLSYRMVKNILEKGLDSQTESPAQRQAIPDHDNIRGATYYN
jgi:transposase